MKIKKVLSLADGKNYLIVYRTNDPLFDQAPGKMLYSGDATYDVNRVTQAMDTTDDIINIILQAQSDCERLMIETTQGDVLVMNGLKATPDSVTTH